MLFNKKIEIEYLTSKPVEEEKRRIVKIQKKAGKEAKKSNKEKSVKYKAQIKNVQIDTSKSLIKINVNRLNLLIRDC